MNRKNELLLTDNQLSLKQNGFKFKSFKSSRASGHCDELKNLPCGTAPKLQLPPGVAMVLK
jgi:hypothetical protein